MKKQLIIFIIIIIFCIISLLLLNNDSEKVITNLLHNNTSIKLIKNNQNIQNNQNFDSKNNSNYIIVQNPVMFNKIATKGELGLAESYMDGDWDTNNLENVLTELLVKQDILTRELYKQSINIMLINLYYKIASILPNNTIESVKKNVSHHYDIGNDLFSKMLDKNMQYTCAYFNKPNMTLDEAQYEKMELIAKKLDLKPGISVIDIGCGFGSLAYHLASKYDVNVVGVTLSKEQKNYADKYFSHPNIKIELKDYRYVQGKFDRVYSVGMFEQVGQRNYHEYYDKCYELLKRDGIMLIHTIVNNVGGIDPFIAKYIFPEGQLPESKHLTCKYMDKWYLEDMQNIGLSYAKTLRSWRENIGNWEGLDNYDTKFRRMWDFYLYGCAAAFQKRRICLWQLVYTKKNTNREDDCYYIRNNNNFIPF